MFTKISFAVILLTLFTSHLFAQFTEITSASFDGVSFSSVDWGDYDNDGDLDILLTGQNSSSYVSKIYRNNGDNTFTDQTLVSPLTGVYKGSAVWGDYDNDGNLDILLTGYTAGGSNRLTKLYHNSGGPSYIFIEQVSTLAPVKFSSAAWGDYDNDGYQDILLMGQTSSSTLCNIYHNNGNSTFSEVSISPALTGSGDGSVAWGDYDNDGDLDILLTASTGVSVSKIYRNDGGNIFTEQSSISLTGVTNGSAAWGDYDNDSYLDILLTGRNNSGLPVSKIYHNNGNNTFTEQTSISLTNVQFGAGAWGDYDNDGDLDILLTGLSEGNNLTSKIYQNNGGTFDTTSIALPPAYVGSIAWGDYDNDGDLDILLAGFVTGFTSGTKIYRNDSPTANTLPTIPSNLVTSVNGDDVTFSWDKSTDNETPQNGLKYNLVIGTSPGAINTLSPMSDRSTGLRRVVNLGNTNHNNSWTIKDLPLGTYHWSVQAIDNNFAGSPFASEQTFDFNVAPVLTTNTGLTLDEGSTSTITNSQLQSTDANNTAAQITYTVTDITDNGVLKLSGNPIAVSGSFTQADIDNNLITYEHDGSETTSDNFTFDVDDPSGEGPTGQIFNITINPVNDVPVLVLNTGLTLNEGAASAITNTQVQSTDADNTAAQITYTVTDITDNGVLKLSGNPIVVNGTFTQNDLNNNVVTYEHNSSETTSDNFTFDVDDPSGEGPTGQVFNITINPLNDAPVLVLDTGITLNEGASSAITNTQLQSTDTDNTAAQITYTVTDITDNGVLKLSGSPLALNGLFTQADIDNNLITYEHNGSETASDNFTFNVDDPSGEGPTGQIFNITISQGNDAPILTINTGLTLNEGAASAITNTQVQSTDADNTAAQITYTVTDITDNGVLKLSGNPITVSGSFTQADIDNNLVSYEHNGNETTSDNFTFDVDDPSSEGPTGQVFNITISSVNNAPLLITNAGLVLNEGTTAAIVNTQLLSTDSDNTAAQITYTVTNITDNGVLKLNGNPIVVNSTLTQNDINYNVITYEHNGTETTSDNFTFDVDDPSGEGPAGQIFSITINPVNDAPVLAMNTGITLNGGTTSAITNTQLQSTDVDNNAAQITYTITDIPDNGTLKLSGNPIVLNGSFTQNDINNNIVIYEHNGSQTTSDTFTFDADDPSGEGPTGQVFSITINILSVPASFVILATNSIWLEASSDILSGDIIVNNVSNGPKLDSGVELSVGIGVTTPGGTSLKANRIRVKKGAQVNSDVYYNYLTNNGSISGSLNSPLTLPVFTNLPPFHQAPAGTQNITVPVNGLVTLTAGNYGNILVRKNGKLLFSGGGTFSMKNLNTTNGAKLLFNASTEILLTGKFDTDVNSYVGPSNGSTINASDIVFYVAGINGNNGNLGAIPKAAQVGLNNVISANFYVPNGTLWLRGSSEATGSFMGKDVIVGLNVKVSQESAFGGNSLAKLGSWQNNQADPFSQVPEQFELSQNFPNPFNPSTVITWQLPMDSHVTLKVYDVLGNEITTLVNEEKSAGTYEVEFNATALSSGVYFYRLEATPIGGQAGYFIQTKKMILLR